MERLQKVMAECGVASRRKSEQLILQGAVKVNGIVITTLGTQVSEEDKIEVNGILLNNERKVYIIMNKPRNTITTVSDDRQRPTVMDKIEDIKERVYPVGRLDFDTTGALILTNDGELTNLLTHPSNEIEKVYIATVKGKVSEEKIKQLEDGVKLIDGITSPAKVEKIKYNPEKHTTILRLTIHEGRNHQIKRMLETINYEVIKLNRESIGGITTKGLYEGQYRHLTKDEIQRLYQLGKK